MSNVFLVLKELSSFLRKILRQSVLVHAFNVNTQDAETDRSLLSLRPARAIL